MSPPANQELDGRAGALKKKVQEHSPLEGQRLGQWPFFSISLQMRDHEQMAIWPTTSPPIANKG